MLNHKEVRIGNTVLHQGKEFNIVSISQKRPELNSDQFKEENLDWYNVSGVQITQERIVKLGFRYDEEAEQYYIANDVGRAKLIYTFDDGQGNPLIMWRYDVGCGEHVFLDSTEYEFVHQLQNLAFSLFGKEIEELKDNQ